MPAPTTAGDYAELKYVDGIPQLPPGRIALMSSAGMMTAAHQPLSKLTAFLETRLKLGPTDQKPVIDKTA